MIMSKQYETTVYIGTVNGKPVRKHIVAGSQRELNEKKNIIKNDVLNKKDVNTKALFGVWAYKWLNEQTKGLNKGTVTQYESAIKHLNRYFEFVSLKDIKLSDFQTVINDLSIENPNTGEPMAKATLENIKKVGAKIFNYAIANDIAGVSFFFNSVKIPKNAPKKERRALTESEIKRIIEFKHRCQLPAMVMLFSGLRRGELMALQWLDIDLTNDIITVNKSVDVQSNAAVNKKGGKSKSAIRLVPIPAVLSDYLKQYKIENNINNPFGLVCTNTKGGQLSATSWRKMWESYLIDLNVKYGYPNTDVSKYDPKGLPMRIERITSHYLRHTFATMLFYQGVDVQESKQYLGHSTIKVTSDIYTDLKNSKFSLSDEYKKHLATDYKINNFGIA